VDNEKAVRELIDKSQIRDVIERCARGSDRVDVDLSRSCYYADSVERHGTFQGNSQEYLSDPRRTSPGNVMNHHLLGQTSIDLENDIAYAETYVLCHQISQALDSEPVLNIVASRYVDRFERRDGEWKIASRTAVIDFGYQYALSDLNVWQRLDDFVRGQRWPDDEVYAARRVRG
jgi:SnoaL-like domain